MEELDLEGFKIYLENIQFGSGSNYSSYIKMLIKILDKIKDYNNLSDTKRIIKFSEVNKNFKERFDQYHDYANKNTFNDLRSGARKYVEFLQQKGKPLIKPKIKKITTKNIILYGPPGVGKTYNHKKLISLIESGVDQKEIFDAIKNGNLDADKEKFEEVKKDGRFKFVTFHQSYSYEDFIEGFRPNEDGSIKLEDGIFKEIAKKAQTQPQKNYYLLIDEINRGNISKIFGELITLIEDDKRDEIEVTLPYSKDPLKVPSNLYIIATMNSTDKSIALIDIALRRRFTFLKMKPDYELVTDPIAKEIFIALNEKIRSTIGEDYLIGHSYFMGEDLDLEFVLEYKIIPLMEEYFYGDDAGFAEVKEILDYKMDGLVK